LTVRVGSGFAWSQLQTTVRPFLGRRTSTIIIEEQSDLQDPFSGGQFDVSTSTKVLRQPHEWLLQLPDGLVGTFFIQAVGVYSKFGVTQYRTSNAIEADAGK
jgi:hypothetical protein